jgi:hypothetical protein
MTCLHFSAFQASCGLSLVRNRSWGRMGTLSVEAWDALERVPDKVEGTAQESFRTGQTSRYCAWLRR